MCADCAWSAAALKGMQKTFVQEQINEYTKKPYVDRAKHMRKLIEGFIIKDPNHHCLRHNLEKLQGVDVRVNGERGLRAKRVRCSVSLLLCVCSYSHCQIYDRSLRR